MRTLRIIRMVVAALFLAATVAYFLTADFRHTDTIETVRLHKALEITEHAQIIPSTIALCMGALLFWLCVTFFAGRFYCSTVCPVGTFSDLFMRLHRELGNIFPKRLRLQFRYKPGRRWRYHIMALYFICLVIGIMAVPFVMEPWNMVRNIFSLSDPETVSTTWAVLGTGVGIGFAAGAAMLLAAAVWGFFSGRDFCNTICPIGQALSLVDRYSLYRIEFDPDKCISCMQCEEVCRSSCIKVTERLVDNSRCVKCLDCVCRCPAGAIRLQSSRNRAATPLAMKSEG